MRSREEVRAAEAVERMAAALESAVESINRVGSMFERMANAADVAVLALASWIENQGGESPIRIQVAKPEEKPVQGADVEPKVEPAPDPWKGVPPRERYRFAGLPGYPDRV